MMTCQTFSVCWPVLGPDMNTGDKDEDEDEDEEEDEEVDEEVAFCRLYTATLPSYRRESDAKNVKKIFFLN